MRCPLIVVACLGLLASGWLQAAELTLELPGGTRQWDTGALLAHPQARELEIPADVAYKRTMHYRAVPLASLLDGVTADDHLQLVAKDGFAAELSAAQRQEVRAIVPKTAEAQRAYSEGVARNQAGECKAAEEALRKAIELEPDVE